jgi:hypothetical protein
MPLPNNWYHLNGTLADVSANTGFRFTVPQAGYLRRVQTHLGAAITGADAIVSVTIDGAAALSPTITIANASSAEGDVDGAEYFAPVNAGSRIEVTSGGESSTTAELAITLTLSR